MEATHSAWSTHRRPAGPPGGKFGRTSPHPTNICSDWVATTYLAVTRSGSEGQVLGSGASSRSPRASSANVEQSFPGNESEAEKQGWTPLQGQPVVVDDDPTTAERPVGEWQVVIQSWYRSQPRPWSASTLGDTAVFRLHDLGLQPSHTLTDPPRGLMAIASALRADTWAPSLPLVGHGRADGHGRIPTTRLWLRRRCIIFESSTAGNVPATASSSRTAGLRPTGSTGRSAYRRLARS